MRTKITTLSRLNVQALEEAKLEVGLAVDTTATTATFPGEPHQAWEKVSDALDALGAVHGRKSHPVASLHAVVRKLSTAATEQELAQRSTP